MNTKHFSIVALIFAGIFGVFAQDKTPQGHTNQNKFKQLKDEFATPNDQHTASGAPGHQYTQQKVDYKMDIVLDDENQKIEGYEEITYHNRSKDVLTYLWLQLDQNKRSKDSKTPDIESDRRLRTLLPPDRFYEKMMKAPFDGGFNIVSVKYKGQKSKKQFALPYKINRTMMRIDLPYPLRPGKKFRFSIKWWYNINNYYKVDGRSGYEHFEKDGNNVYVIAQFFPRLCVYDNVEGWQNMQFWGRSEFALEFGSYRVNITTPKDHILNATGKLLNPKKVLTPTQYKRFLQAKKSFDKPMMIVTQAEAEQAEKQKSKATKTWSFYAKNVRDFGFASSRKFIWDAMAVKMNKRTVMAYSLYPKEGNPLWEEYSTRVVAHTLKVYSRFTFDYPYHKAISVHADRQGMEYPMICWNYGRPREDGTYSQRLKHGMIGVIVHEVGHNFFPMIVNSDERQWTWMDEGLNSFMDAVAQMEFDKEIDTRSLPKDIVHYMRGDQSHLAPIMTQGDNVYHFGPNAYTKPAAGLFILRNTILGHELFDFAFKTYAKRWMFKHPTPEDFFRTMEDASATDLDWFWRGWFYTTDVTDIGIKDVKQIYFTHQPTPEANEQIQSINQQIRDYVKRTGDDMDELQPSELVYTTTDKDSTAVQSIDGVPAFQEYLDKEQLQANKRYFYEVTFEKPGGLVMPIIVEFVYEDGSKTRKTYPAQIWRKQDKEVVKVIGSNKPITSIVVDPDLETADVDTSNNTWPKPEKSEFDKNKEAIKKGN